MIYFVGTYRIEGVENYCTIQETIDKTIGAPIVGLDIETGRDLSIKVTSENYSGGLCPYLSQLVMIQLYNGEDVFVIDARKFTKEELRPLTNYLQWNDDVTFVGANLKFDAKHLKHKLNVDLKKIHDVMICEIALTNGLSRSYALASLVQRYLGVGQVGERTLFEEPENVTIDDDVIFENEYSITPYEVADMEQIDKSTRLQFINIGDKPFTAKQVLYGADDVIYPVKIREFQMNGRMLPSGEIYAPHRLFNLENNTVLVLADMELNGLPLNKEKWLALAMDAEEKLSYYIEELNQYVIQFYDKFKEPPNLFDFETRCTIQWSSSSQVIKFFRSLDIAPLVWDRKTKKQKYSVGADALLKKIPMDLHSNYARRVWIGFEKDENGKYIEDNERLIYAYLVMKKSEQLATTFGKEWLKYVHPITGRVHSNFRQILNSGRMASNRPNCLSLDTEILTPEGWKTYDKVKEGDTVYSFNLETEKLEAQRVEAYYLGEGELYEFTENMNFKAMVTDNHRNLFRNRKTGQYVVKETLDYLKDAHVICASTLEGGIDMNPDLVRLAVAFQADGTYRYAKNKSDMRFGFTLRRKVKRLTDILKRLGIEYKIKDTTGLEQYTSGIRTDIVIYQNESIFEGLIKDKKLTYKFLELSLPLREMVMEEIHFWDGDYTRNHSFLSTYSQNTDVLQAIATTCNKRTLISSKTYREKVYSVLNTTTDRNYTGTANTKLEHRGKGKVWCVTVPNSFIMVRRDGAPFVTGNCQNLPRGAYRKPFEVEGNRTLIFADYSSQELRVTASVSGDEVMRQFFYVGDPIYGEDMHSYTSNLMNKFANPGAPDLPAKDAEGYDDVVDELRNKTKTLEFGIIYGKEARNFAEEWRVSLEEAEMQVNSFLGAYPKLGELMQTSFKETMKQEFIRIDTIVDRRWFSDQFEYLRNLNDDIRSYYPKSYFTFGTPKEEKEKIKEEVYEMYPFVKEMWKEYFGIRGSIQRKSTNYKIQGTSSSQTKSSLILIRWAKITNKYDDLLLINAVHDEIGAECNDENAEKYGQLIEECMARGGNMMLHGDTFMKASAESGKHWVH